ncbi:MAG TPA: peptidoglycan-associated lipoprotein Pal [candidate division Zixibacteria bacterium]|jgi:peptidoglycan-associated lipoprotein|nr:peptidoglycan-associated lipoprotein Pal [candidate division Zixibacteria bacterium]
MNNIRITVTGLAAVLALGVLGCPKKQTVKTDPDPQASTPAAEPARPPQDPQTDPRAGFGTVYFDFDSHAIRDDQKPGIQEAARRLREQGQVRLRLEGHCDERGTVEYNLALGDRRAQAVKGYLQGLGVVPASLETVSFGKERPAAPGSDEASWAKNRRVEIRPGQ